VVHSRDASLQHPGLGSDHRTAGERQAAGDDAAADADWDGGDAGGEQAGVGCGAGGLRDGEARGVGRPVAVAYADDAGLTVGSIVQAGLHGMLQTKSELEPLSVS
jgi:hypothetical protein